MPDDLIAAGIYTDFSGLAELRARAKQGSPDALELAAKQFEAYLVQQLLKAGRDASTRDGIMDSKEGDMYQDLYDKQIAEVVTQGKGLGIARMLVQQVQHMQPTSAGTGASRSTRQEGAGSHPLRAPRLPAAGSTAVPEPWSVQALERAQGQASTPSMLILPETADEELKTSRRTRPQLAVADDATPVQLDTAQEFVAALMPAARRVGAELGVDPRLLVAQAALETGWGKSIIRNSDGTSSHNLFNIKASRGWHGAVASARTLEYENGAAVKVGASFRSYPSFEDSFRDYMEFLRSNPRYGQALQNTHDPAAYAQSLQAAGYATDPKYAAKIMAIYNADEVASAVT